MTEDHTFFPCYKPKLPDLSEFSWSWQWASFGICLTKHVLLMSSLAFRHRKKIRKKPHLYVLSFRYCSSEKLVCWRSGAVPKYAFEDTFKQSIWMYLDNFLISIVFPQNQPASLLHWISGCSFFTLKTCFDLDWWWRHFAVTERKFSLST